MGGGLHYVEVLKRDSYMGTDERFSPYASAHFRLPFNNRVRAVLVSRFGAGIAHVQEKMGPSVLRVRLHNPAL